MLVALIPWMMAGTLSATAQTPTRDSRDAAFTERDVKFEAADGVVLAGVLLIPTGEGPFPGAVIIQGSGDSDRTNFWARSIAEALANGGIATLLPDKRGSGLSEGDWSTASFETLARDALAGTVLVGEEQAVDGRAVGLVGLSQGGHVAPLAAGLSAEVAWVVDISGATVTVIEQIRHELRNTAVQAGLAASEVELIMTIQHHAERYVEFGEWEPYAQALEAAEGGSAASVAAGFPQTQGSPVWTWARLNGWYDPLPHWIRLRIPILVAYGAEDEQDNVPVSESVRRLESALLPAEHPDFTIRVFPGSGHALWDPTSSQGHAPKLRDDLVNLLVEWIHERTP
jgi:pimeloyl-ACP methyl ester carboxylesterase